MTKEIQPTIILETNEVTKGYNLTFYNRGYGERINIPSGQLEELLTLLMNHFEVNNRQ